MNKENELILEKKNIKCEAIHTLTAQADLG